MSAKIDGTLTYRDYVVHVFTGTLFNVFLLAALYTPDTTLFNPLSEMLQKLDSTTEIILSLVSIPILFIEGHFLLAIDRFLFIESPTWLFFDKKHNKDKSGNQSCADNDTQSELPYYAWRKQLYENRRLLFHLLFTKRIIGQRIIKEVKKDVKLVKKKGESGNLSTRYYILSDFFKGCGTSAWIALAVAVVKHNWWCVAVLGAVIVLAWLRCRFYSKLYVRTRYEKKMSEQDAEAKQKSDAKEDVKYVADTSQNITASPVTNTPTVTVNASGEGVSVNNHFHYETIRQGSRKDDSVPLA
ncbi:MAG: hypothetical protein IJT51_02695 [Bacteroidales bacterium]|nr:hypothetical protein [Bacteroidales bacterium]